MRAKQANILEILKVWLKASAAERTAQAGIVAEALANEAKADNKVSRSVVHCSRWHSAFVPVSYSILSTEYNSILIFWSALFP